ncbi:MAG: hypothetical protein MHPSP_002477 [Paramarteilia canceri]
MSPYPDKIYFMTSVYSHFFCFKNMCQNHSWEEKITYLNPDDLLQNLSKCKDKPMQKLLSLESTLNKLAVNNFLICDDITINLENFDNRNRTLASFIESKLGPRYYDFAPFTNSIAVNQPCAYSLIGCNLIEPKIFKSQQITEFLEREKENILNLEQSYEFFGFGDSFNKGFSLSSYGNGNKQSAFDNLTSFMDNHFLI